MSRIYLLLAAAALSAGALGCAQCDTCDDFPAPCTGPNCGHNQPGIMDMLPPGQPAMSQPMPVSMPMNDAAGPAPVAPPTPAVDPTSPPL
jgi:hypothetical protein